MGFKLRKFFLLCAVMLCAAAANADKITWADVERDARGHLENLISINTAQPEGNEIAAARYIYKILNENNIDWEIYRPEKKRASLSAVIRGADPKKEPLMLLVHLDTVPPGSGWTKQPFKATVENGKIYGLGSWDDKNFAAIYLTLIIWLKQNDIKPERDIIFLATADEEAGGNKGLKWLINSPHWKKLKPGYALNEGGGIMLEEGRPPIVFVEAVSKMYMDIKITAYGSGGHPSAGTANNAVYNLSQALSKIEKLKIPYAITPFTKLFFSQVLPTQETDAQTTINILLGPNAASARMAAEIIAEDPFFKTQLQDTVTPTVIASGSEANVNPGEASAVLNCRLLQSTNPDEFVAGISALFEQDENISIEVLEKPLTPFPQPASGRDELFAAISRAGAEAFPGSVTLLGMTPASSDAEFLRRQGVITYGVGAPYEISSPGRYHAPDEYIEETAFSKQLVFFFNAVYNFTAGAVPLSEFIE